MAKNTTLTAARKAKNDEFYTRRCDIENELRHYEKYFENKIVYCNCDDPEKSEFWKFFLNNIRSWKIKKLIATHYEPDAANYSYYISADDGKLDEAYANAEQWCKETGAKGFDISNFYKPEKIRIESNGDFRSAACVELLKEADIVVSNPPFSLLREYIAQLIEYDKKFLIVGNPNAITYKEVFPLIQDNRMWLGMKPWSTEMYFSVTDEMAKDLVENKKERSGYVRIDGEIYARASSVWFTNLDNPKRHEKLDLRGCDYKGRETFYPKYDNYDAINVDKVVEIPGDYFGVIGVPITYLDKYDPSQFEILGVFNHGKDGPWDFAQASVNGVWKYKRLAIRRIDVG